mmetsp:Transcript_21309/g.45341  ORF Transcript_21309/g.45341 Transcript_21309/m.45341 type:complete len:536 (+) Transcript_21309:303-1910(+)
MRAGWDVLLRCPARQTRGPPHAERAAGVVATSRAWPEMPWLSEASASLARAPAIGLELALCRHEKAAPAPTPFCPSSVPHASSLRRRPVGMEDGASATAAMTKLELELVRLHESEGKRCGETSTGVMVAALPLVPPPISICAATRRAVEAEAIAVALDSIPSLVSSSLSACSLPVVAAAARAAAALRAAAFRRQRSAKTWFRRLRRHDLASASSSASATTSATASTRASGSPPWLGCFLENPSPSSGAACPMGGTTGSDLCRGAALTTWATVEALGAQVADCCKRNILGQQLIPCRARVTSSSYSRTTSTRSKAEEAEERNVFNVPPRGGAKSTAVPEGFSNRRKVFKSAVWSPSKTSAARIQSNGFMPLGSSPHNNRCTLTRRAEQAPRFNARLSSSMAKTVGSPSVSSTCFAPVHTAVARPARPVPAPSSKTRFRFSLHRFFVAHIAKASSEGLNFLATSPYKKPPPRSKGRRMETVQPAMSYAMSLQALSQLKEHFRLKRPQSERPSCSASGTIGARGFTAAATAASAAAAS